MRGKIGAQAKGIFTEPSYAEKRLQNLRESHLLSPRVLPSANLLEGAPSGIHQGTLKSQLNPSDKHS